MTGKEEAMRNGFMPHDGNTLVCECGCDIFECPPQSVDLAAPVWGYEHVCTRCGKMTTIYVKRK